MNYWLCFDELMTYALLKVVQPQYTGEVGKFITFWCQISSGYRTGYQKS